MAFDIGRRQFIFALGTTAVAWPLAPRAQVPFKIGLLDTGLGDAFTVPFVRKLGQLGYSEGKNVVIVRRAAEGDIGRLKDRAADLVAQRVDVIVTAGTPAGFAANKPPAQSPSCLAPTATRWVLAWLQASPGPAAMSPALR